MKRIALILALLLLQAASAYADDNLHIGSLTLNLMRKNKSMEIALTSAEIGAGASAKIFYLENPSRVVLDLSPALSLSGRYRLNSDGFLRVRIGTAEGRSRFVFDVDEKTKVASEFKSDIKVKKGSLQIVAKDLFGGEERHSLQAKPAEAPEAIPKVESSASTPALPVSPTPQTTNAKTKITLEQIRFETAGENAGFLLLEFSGVANYSLIKGSKRITVIAVEGASFSGDHLRLEQFPPEGFSGLEVVIPRAETKGIKFELNVDDGFNVHTDWAGKTLRIRMQRE